MLQHAPDLLKDVASESGKQRPTNKSPEAIAAERNFMDFLKRSGHLDKRPDLKGTYIAPDVILVERKEGPIGFAKENGEVHFWLKSVRNPEEIFIESSIFAQYREIKKGDKYEMYRLQDINLKTGKPFPNSKPISPHTAEYYKAWIDLDFFCAKHGNRRFMLGTADTKRFVPYHDGSIDTLVETGAIRIKELLRLHKQKQVSDQAFYKQLARMPDLLPKQCADSRFARMNDEVTMDELKGYLNYKDEQGNPMPLITQGVYDRCVEIIEIREKNKKAREEVHKKTQSLIGDRV